jgi:tRNA A-37 threonylcarbamoyl transferase component Bud32
MTKKNQTLGCFDGYELIEAVGRGGMGIVYKAKQIDLDRIVALKMILDSQFASPTDLARFQTEAKAAANLNHPGIVAVHEIGEHNGQPYYTMDFVPGPTLANVLKKSSLSPVEAASLTLHVAQAVAHAHANDVLHRDLKPSNILIDSEGYPRVADFGLAKRTQDTVELTLSGQALGTPCYMSPEQAAGRHAEVGPRSDVYGLGAVLYATLTGVPPVCPTNRADALRSVIQDLPLPPRTLNPVVDRDLESVCLKCLEKRPADRYASASDLADDLRRYLNGASTAARPRTYMRNFWHWTRRPQRTIEAGGVILIIAAFYGLCAAVGLCTLLFAWVPIEDHAHAAAIVGLDSAGFALCLPIGLGMLARQRWFIWSGLFTGSGMTIIVLALIGNGFEGGGLLPEPFHRVTVYSIFGFVGIVMTGVSLAAMISHQAQQADAATKNGHNGQGSTKQSNLLETTVDM